jgi:hypothetical protein
MNPQGEETMRDRFSHAKIMAAIAAAGSAVTSISISISITPTSAQAPAASVTIPSAALKTPWGEPDLQGIWKDEFDTPPQRPALGRASIATTVRRTARWRIGA